MLKFLFLFILLIESGPVPACPALLYMDPDLPGLKGKREHLRLFTWEEESRSFVSLPVQTDAMSKGGGIVFGLPSDWMQQEIQSSDRIVFEPQIFGPLQPAKGLPCQGPVTYLIRDFNDLKKGAFLTVCPGKAPAAVKRVIYQEKDKRLYSQNYSYSFNAGNAMLFHSVFITKKNRRYLAAYHSDINIYSDIPRFFDMHFGAHNIESEIAVIDKGPLGINANVSFFVRILFLRLKLSLSTDVSFYNDAAHIPMVLYLPVNPEEYLASGSGILYTWLKSEDFAKSPKVVNMPQFSAPMKDLLLNNEKAYKELGQQYCTDPEWCHFSIQVVFLNKPFVMQFSLPRDLIQKGFFPVFTSDPQALIKDLGWDMKLANGSKDVEGVFFKSSGLSSGNSSWDFWLKLGGMKKGRGGLCPYPITLRRSEDPG